MDKSLEKELGKNLQQGIGALVELAYEENPQETALISPEARKTAMEQDLSKQFEHIKKQCAEGATHLFQSLKELSIRDPSINIEECAKAFEQVMAKNDSIDKLHTCGIEVIDGKTLRTTWDISHHVIQMLYTAGKSLLDAKKYNEAEQAFTFLSLLDSEQYEFWACLGHSRFFLNNFEQAINAYSMAERCDPNSYWPYIWVADCYELQKDWANTCQFLEFALAGAEESKDPDSEKIRKELQERLSYAKKQQ